MSSSFSFLPRGRFTLWALLLAFLLCACGGGGSPESVAEAGVWAMAENRAEDLIKLHSSNLRQSKHDDLRLEVLTYHMRTQTLGGLKSVETELVGQEEDKAVVKVEVIYGNGETDRTHIRLIKKSDEWKLAAPSERLRFPW
jgi:hypothetical protein